MYHSFEAGWLTAHPAGPAGGLQGTDGVGAGQHQPGALPRLHAGHHGPQRPGLTRQLEVRQRAEPDVRPGRGQAPGTLMSRLVATSKLPITWQACALYAVAFGGLGLLAILSIRRMRTLEKQARAARDHRRDAI